jgi:hypothetical protein
MMIATEFSAPNVWTGPGPFFEQFLGHVLLRLGSKNLVESACTYFLHTKSTFRNKLKIV